MWALSWGHAICVRAQQLHQKKNHVWRGAFQICDFSVLQFLVSGQNSSLVLSPKKTSNAESQNRIMELFRLEKAFNIIINVYGQPQSLLKTEGLNENTVIN